MSEEVLGDGVQDGKLIVGIGRESVLCVVQLDRGTGAKQGREVSVAHRRGDNASLLQTSSVRTGAFVVGEEEELVLQNRASYGSAKDGLSIGIDRDNGVGELVGPRVSVEVLVLEEGVGRAVELVGSGLQDRDDGTSVGVAELCGSIGGDNADLGNGIGRWVIGDEVVLRFVEIGTVEGVVVGLVAVAIDGSDAVVEGAPLDGVVAGHSLGVGGDGAGLEEGHGGEVASVEWDVGDLVGGEGDAKGGVVGVEDRSGLGADIGDGGGSAGLELGIELGGLVDLEGEGGELRGGEAGGGYGDLVLADGKEAGAVEADLVGGDGCIDAGSDVMNDDSRVGNDRSAGIGDDATDGTGNVLCV